MGNRIIRWLSACSLHCTIHESQPLRVRTVDKDVKEELFGPLFHLLLMPTQENLRAIYIAEFLVKIEEQLPQIIAITFLDRLVYPCGRRRETLPLILLKKERRQHIAEPESMLAERCLVEVDREAAAGGSSSEPLIRSCGIFPIHCRSRSWPGSTFLQFRG